MSFFIPEGAQWNALSRDATKQRVLAGAAAAAGLTGLTGITMPYGRKRFNYISRNDKRQRINRRFWNRGRARLRGKKMSSGKGITNQHDRRFIYAKKRMPRGRRRAWKRFIRKVNAVDERDLGSQTVVMNNFVNSSTTDPDDQIAGGVALYPYQSGSAHMNDLTRMSTYFNTSNPTAAADDYLNSTAKVIFKSAVLDVTVRNGSDNGAEVEKDIPLEVDVYEITIRKGQDDSVAAYATINDYFTQGSTDTLAIGGTAAGAAGDLTISRRGVTPWDLPSALSMYGIKIWKKTKFFLGSGQTFTYQMRDPKRHVITLGKMARGQECNYNGLTKHVLFLAKAVPGVTVGASDRARLDIGVTRKYLMKVEGLRTARDYYYKA